MQILQKEKVSNPLERQRRIAVSVVPKGAPVPDPQDEEGNPVMQAFLSFLAGQMTAHPELIEPVTEAQMAHIAALVEGVEPG